MLTDETVSEIYKVLNNACALYSKDENKTTTVQSLKVLLQERFLDGVVIKKESNSLIITGEASTYPLKEVTVDGFTLKSDAPLLMLQGALLTLRDGSIPQDKAENIVLNLMFMLLDHVVASAKMGAAILPMMGLSSNSSLVAKYIKDIIMLQSHVWYKNGKVNAL